MAEKTEKVGNAKAAVQAAKIIQGAATGGLPGAAIATVSDPRASFALVKKIIIAVTVILMIPTVIASSIPSSIINPQKICFFYPLFKIRYQFTI